MPTGDCTLDIAKTPDGIENEVVLFIGVQSPIIYIKPNIQADDMNFLVIIAYKCLPYS